MCARSPINASGRLSSLAPVYQLMRSVLSNGQPRASRACCSSAQPRHFRLSLLPYLWCTCTRDTHYQLRCRRQLQVLTSPPNADNHLCNHDCGICCAYPRGCARAPTARLSFLSVRCVCFLHVDTTNDCFHQSRPKEMPACRLKQKYSLTCRGVYGNIGMPNASSRSNLENVFPRPSPSTW